MRMIKVNRNDVLDSLMANQDKHIEQYEAAMKAWESQVLKRLTVVRREAGKGDFTHVQQPLRELPQPISFKDSYETAIAQLTWEVEEFIQLDASEFSQYVEDNWNWSNQFTVSNARYA